MTATEETNNVATTERAGNTGKERSTSRYIAVLASGDLLAFLAFSAIGRGSHGEATGLAAIPAVIMTAAPFAVAWFIVSPFVGVYRRELVAKPRKMAIRTFIAWVLSWPVAMALRGIFVDHAVPPFTFALIALFVNAAFLLLWRWPYALNNSIKKRS
jgi:Protein of unknown function (DUF3054)